MKLIVTIEDQTHDVPDCPGKHVHSHQVSAEIDYSGDDKDKSCNGSIAHAISHIVGAVELVLDHLYGKPIARGGDKEAAFEASRKAHAEREARAAENPDDFPTDPELFEIVH